MVLYSSSTKVTNGLHIVQDTAASIAFGSQSLYYLAALSTPPHADPASFAATR